MKNLSLILTVVAAIIAYLTASSSQKTTGKVEGFIPLTIDFTPPTTALILNQEKTSIHDLTLPQLISLDKDTVAVIKKATEEDGEKTAGWAVNLENDIAQLKVLKLVLSTWADITPHTTAVWTETLPAFDKYLDLYQAVAAAWAQNNPTFAIDKWALNLEKENFKVPVLRTITEVWASNDPENAGDWLLFLNSDDFRKAIYPNLIHAWFPQSPQDTFDWLVKFKGTDEADIDSLYLIKKWINKDSKKAFTWLTTEYSTPFIDSLRKVAAVELAKTNLKLAKKFIADEKMENVHINLINAIINESTGKNDQQALETIEKIRDLDLKDKICYAAAMKLAGTKSSAIKYVEATGFLRFPDLQGFFEKWATKKGEEATEWFRSSSASTFSQLVFKRLIAEWNQNNPNDKHSPAEVIPVAEYIPKTNKVPELLLFDDIQLPIRTRFLNLMKKWEDQKKELFLATVSQWARSNYTQCINYISPLEESAYKFLFLKGVLPETPYKKIDDSMKMCQALKNTQYRQDLVAYLALAIASEKPEQALTTLRKARRLNAYFVYQVIDQSIQKKSNELLIALKKTVRKNLHIFMPYYFYIRATTDPEGSYAEVKKITKETFYAQSLKAVAASYADFHSPRLLKWQNSLSDDEKAIVGKLIYSLVENL